MVESLDFSLGIILGVIITFAGNYLTEKWRESKERKSVATALIAELERVKERVSKYETHKITTNMFFTVVPKLLLFKKQIIDAILETYNEIDLRKSGGIGKDSEKVELTKQIDNTIETLKKELDC